MENPIQNDRWTVRLPILLSVTLAAGCLLYTSQTQIIRQRLTKLGGIHQMIAVGRGSHCAALIARF